MLKLRRMFFDWSAGGENTDHTWSIHRIFHIISFILNLLIKIKRSKLTKKILGGVLTENVFFIIIAHTKFDKFEFKLMAICLYVTTNLEWFYFQKMIQKMYSYIGTKRSWWTKFRSSSTWKWQDFRFGWFLKNIFHFFVFFFGWQICLFVIVFMHFIWSNVRGVCVSKEIYGNRFTENIIL